MTKRLLSIFISIVMLLSISHVAVFAEDDILSYLTYEIVDGEVTIEDCDTSISGDIVIPDTIEGYPVTIIGDNAFSGCDNLTSITIPNSVTTIGNNTFCSSGITDITIPANVENIGRNPFYDCTSLECITVDENNKNYSNDEYGVLFNKDLTELISYPSGNSRTSYNIPESVIIIGDSSFFHCMNLSCVTIPDSVITVCADAFSSCIKLESVTFGNGLTTIGSWAFACCSFETIDLPDSLKIIDYTAFGYCYFLKSLTIPEGIERIEPSTFVGCCSLEKINFPDSLKHIDCAFDICLSLEEISMPKNMTTFGEYAFSTSGRLKHIYIYNTNIDLTDSKIGYRIREFNADIDEFTKVLNEIKSSYIDGENIDEELATYVNSYVYLDEPVKIEDFTIHGYKGSTAEIYANEHSFKFVPICDHINTETINIAEADCDNDGYTGDVYCNDCEEIISNGKTIPATGHNYIENIIKEPSYSQDGIKNSVCENCGDTIYEVKIPMFQIDASEEKEDSDTGVSVIFPDGSFEDKNVKIEVTPVEEGEAYKLISHKEGNYKVTMFDINVTVDGEKVQPNGTVLVKIPLPKGYNQNKCVVYYVADDGTMEELKTYHHKDGYVYFETDHFSYYAVIDETEENDCLSKIKEFFTAIVEFFTKLISQIKDMFSI